MRKIMRNIARANMRKMGLRHVNKPMRDRFGAKTLPSYFARRWREFA